MDPNQTTEQQRVVLDTPGVRREVVTERIDSRPSESAISTGMVALIAVFAITVIGITVYVVTNRNANESANRNANIEVASQPGTPQSPPPTIVQQPAAPQQAPIIIQQPAQPASVVIQEPAPNAGPAADAVIQDVVVKRLMEDLDMGSVSATVIESRVVLTGNATSQAIKGRAERLVKEVPGVKSVENKIFVSGG